MSALGSLANALLDASRVADLNMHVGSYLLSGTDVRFGSKLEVRALYGSGRQAWQTGTKQNRKTRPCLRGRELNKPRPGGARI